MILSRSDLLPALVITSSLSFVASSARAAETTPNVASASDRSETSDDRGGDAWERRRIAILARGELFGPIGLGGIGLEGNLTRRLAVGGGFGTNSFGPEYALMARYRIPVSDNFGFGLGLGGSYGAPTDARACGTSSDGDCGPPKKAFSVDSELFAEGRSDEGFVIRFYGGMHRTFSSVSSPFGGAYVGLALGYSL